MGRNSRLVLVLLAVAVIAVIVGRFAYDAGVIAGSN